MESPVSQENSSNDQNSVVQFKKKKINKKFRRKKGEESDGSAEKNDESSIDILTDLRKELESKKNSKMKGVTSLIIVDSAAKNNLSSKNKEAEEKYVSKNEDEPTGQSLLQMIDSQFKSGGEGGIKAVAHENLMEAYVEEKLNLRSSAKDNAPSLLSEEDKLYIIPDEIKKKVQDAKVMFGTAKLDDDDDWGHGSQIAWSTGIAEVDLPPSVKQRNVEATKVAFEQLRKMQLLHDKSHSGIVSSSLMGSFAANFSRHMKDNAQKAKVKEALSNQKVASSNVDTEESRVAKEPDPAQTAKYSSNDDKFYERFKKRSRKN